MVFVTWLPLNYIQVLLSITAGLTVDYATHVGHSFLVQVVTNDTDSHPTLSSASLCSATRKGAAGLQELPPLLQGRHLSSSFFLYQTPYNSNHIHCIESFVSLALTYLALFGFAVSFFWSFLIEGEIV